MSNPPVVTRFAPSPTGALHVGGVRTALFNWAFARRHGGQFILRMEDTDKKRSSERAAESILADLEWLGLDFDDGPYHQSKRLDLYNQQIDRLLAKNKAYEVDRAVRFRMDADIAFSDDVYGHIEVKQAELEDFVIRKSDGFPTFHMAVVVDDADMGVTHVIRGQEHLYNTTKHVALQDALGINRPCYAHTPTILNSDGSKMSKRDKAKVARAAAIEYLKKTGKSPKDWLDEILEDQERIRHLVESTGRKLDHRELADLMTGFLDKLNDDLEPVLIIADFLKLNVPEIDVFDFQWSGYLPEALCNYLALLGWSPGNDIETFDKGFLTRNFDLMRINKANPKFDRQKLLEFNRRLIAEMALPEFKQAIWNQPATNDRLLNAFTGPEDPRLDLLAKATQERSRTLRDPIDGNHFLFSQHFEYKPAALKKVLEKNGGNGFEVLRELESELKNCEPWTSDQIEETLKQFAQKKDLGMGKVAQPLRVAVSGGTVSPPIGDTLAILGRQSTLKRIERCLVNHAISPG